MVSCWLKIRKVRNPENLYRVGIAAKILRFRSEGRGPQHLAMHLRTLTIEEVSKLISESLPRLNTKRRRIAVTEELKAYAIAVITTLKELHGRTQSSAVGGD